MEKLLIYLLAKDVGVLEQKFRITWELVDGLESQCLCLSQPGFLVKENQQINK